MGRSNAPVHLERALAGVRTGAVRQRAAAAGYRLSSENGEQPVGTAAFGRREAPAERETAAQGGVDARGCEDAVRG